MSSKPVAYRFDPVLGVNIAIYEAAKSNKSARTWQPFEKYRIRNMGRKRAFFNDTYRGVNGVI
jgi:hypothetical protein